MRENRSEIRSSGQRKPNFTQLWSVSSPVPQCLSQLSPPPHWLPLDQWLRWPMKRGYSTQASTGLSCFLFPLSLLQLPHHESVGPKRERISHNLWINSPLCPLSQNTVWFPLQDENLQELGGTTEHIQNVMMAPLHNRQYCQSRIFPELLLFLPVHFLDGSHWVVNANMSTVIFARGLRLCGSFLFWRQQISWKMYIIVNPIIFQLDNFWLETKIMFWWGDGLV